MTSAGTTHSFAYNGAPPSEEKCICLDYRDRAACIEFKVPRFEAQLVHIPDRYLDLLEMAAYVYCADRRVSRGEADSPHFASWRRHFRHSMAVNDLAFWSSGKVKGLLRSMLGFMTGDDHEFEFVRGAGRQKMHMFDEERFLFPPGGDTRVIMFSGGLDCTSGVLDVLHNTDARVILASHVSNTTALSNQNRVIRYLKNWYPGRLDHFHFTCHLKGARAREETQRSRAFLYAAVGATVARAYGQNDLYMYENGVVSINLPPAEQYKNARASRTTHPRVLHDLSQLLTLVGEAPFKVVNPFLWKTKTDVVTLLAENGGVDLLNQTVSCSRTFDEAMTRENTHCGRCSQCIDRRFATAAAGFLPMENRAIYAFDLVTDDICPEDSPRGREERTLLTDYIGLAIKLRRQTAEAFEDQWLDEITDVDAGFDDSPPSLLEDMYKLFSRHGEQVEEAISQFRSHYRTELLESETAPNSLEDILRQQDYLKTQPVLLAARLGRLLSRSATTAFASQRPKNEKAVQDHLQAIMDALNEDMQREFPMVRFGFGSAIPDFSKADLIIEVKYVRAGTSPSKATDPIMADCGKYPRTAHLLFFVYDPDLEIRDVDVFRETIQKVRPAEVVVVH